MDDLIEAARQAQENAYAPYSEYAVGAAIQTADGEVFTGCNVEVVNFSNSLHAEEVALGKAISAGKMDLAAVAVTSAARDGVTPCGMCRQSLAEFASEDLPIYCDEGDAVAEYTLGELLPETMTGEMIE